MNNLTHTTINSNKKILATLIASLSLTVAGCSDGDKSCCAVTTTPGPQPPVVTPSPSVIPPVDIPDILSSARLVINNAENNQLVSSNVEYEVITENPLVKSDIEIQAEPVEGKVNTYTSTNGTLFIKRKSFGGDPYTVRVIVKADGFFSSSADCILSEDGSSEDIVLVNLTKKDFSNDSVGIEIDSTETTTNQSGAITADIVIPVGDEDGVTDTEVTIPSGVTMTDKDGQAVDGKLTVNVAYFPTENTDSADATQTSALEALPGGNTVDLNNFDVSPVAQAQIDSGVLPSEPGTTTADNNDAAFNFVSAGFAAIEVTDEAGNEVANFDGGDVEVKMMLAADTFNPEENRAILEGDVIPYWSYDTNTGKWTLEGNVEVGAEDNGFFPVSFVTDHLSYFNLDWWTNQGACDVENVTIVDEDGNPNTAPLTAVFKGNGFTRTRFLSDDTLNLWNAPRGLNNPKMTLLYEGEPAVTRIQLNNLPDPTLNNGFFSGEICSLSNSTITVASGTQKPVDTQISVSTQCKQDPSIKVQLPFGVDITAGGSYVASFDSVKTGFNTVGLNADTTYTLTTPYDDAFNPFQYHSIAFTPTEANKILEWMIPIECKVINPTPTPIPPTPTPSPTPLPPTGATGGSSANGQF